MRVLRDDIHARRGGRHPDPGWDFKSLVQGHPSRVYDGGHPNPSINSRDEDLLRRARSARSRRRAREMEGEQVVGGSERESTEIGRASCRERVS